MSRIQIKILIVADGIFSFGPQTHDDNIFTLTFLVKSLTLPNGPLDPLEITVDTAHRDGEVLFDGNSDPAFPFPKSSFATIPGKFRFAGPLVAGEVTRPLGEYDEIWLFGYNGVNPNVTIGPDGVKTVSGLDPVNKSQWVDMTGAELTALAAFMNQGGGIFAAGDHGSLGAPLCGKIPRVRTMRKWWHDEDPTKPSSQSYVGNWPSSGVTRADTLMPATTRIGDLFETRWDTQNQSDDVPQVLHPTFIGVAHPILQTSSGPLNVMPDHMHEGEVCGFGGSRGALPYSIIESLSYVGPDFAGSLEYPTIYPVNGQPHQERPEILATGVVQAGHVTTSSKPAGVCNDPFYGDPQPTAGISTLNIISAYDGHAAGVGRVITDSSFHHYLDVNLLGDPCASAAFDNSEVSGFQQTNTLQQMTQFYRNLAQYLAGPLLIALDCIGNTVDNRKVYCIGGNNKIDEFSVHRKTPPPHLPYWAMNGFPDTATRQGSAVACWTLDNVHNQIYYLDADNHVNESSTSDTFPLGSITRMSSIPSRLDSGLACAGPRDGTRARVYFINSSSQIVQLTYDASTSRWTDQTLPGPTAAEGSTLTALYSPSDGISVFYYSSAGAITWVSEDDGPDRWIFDTVVTDGSPSYANIAALLVNGLPHVFYVDSHLHNVCSMTLGGGRWNKTVLPGLARLEGSWLTGYVRNETEPVIFYVARDGIINELAWNAATSTWTNTVLPGHVVRTRSQISCLEAAGQAEIYYRGFEGRIYTLNWEAARGWANSSLLLLVFSPPGH
ncbi:hypothetical protein GP486_004726 [Trichoglossum hirsutum]|uniref:Fucose-specific lectin n=1 Tax=Trichoglossum hirsutum TaxID=265104 RepID=A0A9P8LAI2_9PEZI|nr:hypothetical protein GP486_004726 [Trichoglossum hirsutum]